MSQVKRRIFVGGLPPNSTTETVSTRFKSFGNITDCVVKEKFPRCFAYINIETTAEKLNKMIAIYNGAKWHNSILRIEEAKTHFLVNLLQEIKQRPHLKEKKKRKRVEKQQKLETGTKNKLWVKTNDDRYLPKFKVRLPQTNRQILFDPSKVENHKFLNLELINEPESSNDILEPYPNYHRKAGVGMYTQQEIEEYEQWKAAREEAKKRENTACQGLSKRKCIAKEMEQARFEHERNLMEDIVGSLVVMNDSNDAVVEFLDEDDKVPSLPYNPDFDSD